MTIIVMMLIVPAIAQSPLRGKVLDKLTNKPIAGATIKCLDTEDGTSSDAMGFFVVMAELDGKQIEVQALGYKILNYTVDRRDSLPILLLEKEDKEIEAVEITQKVKYNRRNPATEIIDLVIKHKKFNKLTRKDSLFFRQYEKVKFGLVNPQKGFSTRLGDMSFFFKNTDTTVIEGEKTLSLFMQEGVSDNYIKQHPSREKKIIIAEERTEFDPRYVNNHNIEAYLNYILQPVDVYDESIYFVNKLFLSPIADNAKTYYKYYIADTIRNGDNFNIRIKFEPFNKQDLLFTGELIISMDGQYAVERANMYVGKQANLAWVTNLNMKLSYFKNAEGIMLQDSSHVLVQFGSGKADVLFGERFTVNEDYDLNYPITKEIFEGAPVEKKISPGFSLEQLRPVALSIAEQLTYINVEQLNQLKSFRTIAAVGYLVSQGYYSLGKFELGPLEYLYHRNNIEGNRIRIGGRTTSSFSERVYMQGYLAYGLRDKELKYYLKTAVSLNGKSVTTFPAHYLEGTVQHDIFDPGKSIGFLKGDSFFRSFAGNRPSKWLNTDAYRLGHLIEFGNHVSINTSFTHQRRTPIGDLKFISSADSSVLLKNINTNDIQVVLRWAPFEKFYYRNLERSTIVENHPVFSLQYNKGIKGFWGAQYNYDAVRLSVSKRFFMNQVGFGDVTVTGGKIFGVLPYPLLEIPNFSEISDRHSISYERTNSMEFVADQYIKLAYDHEFNGFILNKIPLIKKLKLREIAGVRMFYGRLSRANNPLLSDQVVHFDRNDDGYVMTNILRNEPYWEGYVGLQNIFKVFQVQYYKRLNYVSSPITNQGGFWRNLRVSVKLDF